MERFQTMLTLFVSVDLSKQKFSILKEISGNSLDWNRSSLIGLVNRKMYQFVVEFDNPAFEDDYPDVVHFNQMRIYDLDESEKELQLKELALPAGYEHEFVPRSVIIENYFQRFLFSQLGPKCFI